ncbi:MAG: FAD-binding oxidoreductase [Alteromonadaceae bacterium]|nr:FAD-binding oxidoreductase [Alteromonadaceae bacterium]
MTNDVAVTQANGNKNNEEFFNALRELVGVDCILAPDKSQHLYTDVYRRLSAPVAVIQPTSVTQVQAVVKHCSASGYAVSVRGGGASYTDGYLPSDDRQVLLDMSHFNRIIEINEEDGYVTVEAGVTWASLKETLDAKGLRTPFWGPFSGLRATIGGAVSQNSISHGSGSYGISAQSVQAITVVLGNGELLKTGSTAAGSTPFCRFFGPDLTGLFTGDASALGIKVSITLPLLRKRAAHQTISFAFNDFNAMHESMRLISQENLEDTHFALDGGLSQGQIARQDNAGQTIKMALSILKSSPSFLSGIKQLITSAVSARRVISSSPYMTHYIVEGVNDAEAKSRLQRIRELNLKLGQEIPATVPAVVRGMPFAPFYNALGPQGERWVPLHGVLAHSKVKAFHNALEAFYAKRAADLKKHGVWYGGMFATVGSSGFLYEIAIYWPDEITDYHKQVIPADYLAKLPRYDANKAARDYVLQLKDDMTALFIEYGAINFQLGKAYPYLSRLDESGKHVLNSIKRAADENGVISPGNLGFAKK